jgi:hypothetical protein
MDNEALKQFAEKLLQEKGTNDLDLDQAVLDQMKEDLISRLEDRVNAVTLTAIPSEKLEEFEQLIDKNSLEAAQKFVSDNVPNLNELIAQELLFFRDTYLKG